MKLYNTQTRQKVDFKPLGDEVLIYSCGLTVYSQPHIGNWVGYIYWDVLVRLLRYQDFAVKHVQNITDVGHLTSDNDEGQDKMQKAASDSGVTAWDIADKFIKIADHEAYDLLKLNKPDLLVRATDCIDQQIAMGEQLEKGGYTYKNSDGIYFDTSKLTNYGELARLDIDGLQAGQRVKATGKKNVTDFAVWKFSPQNSQRDMEWQSPWGVGFPGWHLECSAIAYDNLGAEIDIHTGGIDHIPVHHTNEIAQTESVTGKKFVRNWLHNNHLKVDGKKMSKSLGNIYTLHDIVAHGYRIMDFKLFVLEKHYRTEGNFTWETLGSAHNRLHNWRNYAAIRHQTHDTLDDDKNKDNLDGYVTFYAEKRLVIEALNDDLNTPQAMAIIDQAFSKLDNQPLDKVHRSSLVEFLEMIDDLFAIDLIKSTPDINTEVKQLLIKRNHARDQKDWAQSDVLRDELAVLRIAIKDTPRGTVWQYSD